MLIYQLLIRLLSPLIVAMIIVDTIKRQGGWPFILQRLGFYYPKCSKCDSPIWIHCASVGEVRAAEALIRTLLAQNKPTSILVTTSTPSGQQLAQQLFTDNVTYRYLPLDWPYAIRHFIRRHTPTSLWIMETELWPNLYRIAAQKNMQLMIVNGRLTEKTLKAPKWLKAAFRNALSHVQQILARSQLDADRYLALGAQADKIKVIGNLKFANLKALADSPKPLSQPYMLFASSRDREERPVVEAWLSLNRPELLVIVPRHPQRRDEILSALADYRDRIAVHSLGETPDDKTQIYVDDRFGVLMAYFQHAEVVIMGGAFTPRGGHNILEPAAYGKAVITGADMSDFQEEMALLKEQDAIVQIESTEQLGTALAELLEDPVKRQQIGENARRVVENQTGIVETYLTHLKN